MGRGWNIRRSEEIGVDAGHPRGKQSLRLGQRVDGMNVDSQVGLFQELAKRGRVALRAHRYGLEIIAHAEIHHRGIAIGGLLQGVDDFAKVMGPPDNGEHPLIIDLGDNPGEHLVVYASDRSHQEIEICLGGIQLG